MTHFGFVVTAYALGLGIPLVFTVSGLVRLRAATRRLAAIDPRQNRGTAS